MTARRTGLAEQGMLYGRQDASSLSVERTLGWRAKGSFFLPLIQLFLHGCSKNGHSVLPVPL